MIPVPDPDDQIVEMLIPEHTRSVSVNDHQHWLETLSAESQRPFDEIDEAVEEGGEQ